MTQFVTPSFLLSPWLVFGSLLTLTACGGGSSGGGSNGGQDPDPVVVDIPKDVQLAAVDYQPPLQLAADNSALALPQQQLQLALQRPPR